MRSAQLPLFWLNEVIVVKYVKAYNTVTREWHKPFWLRKTTCLHLTFYVASLKIKQVLFAWKNADQISFSETFCHFWKLSSVIPPTSKKQFGRDHPRGKTHVSIPSAWSKVCFREKSSGYSLYQIFGHCGISFLDINAHIPYTVWEIKSLWNTQFLHYKL